MPEKDHQGKGSVLDDSRVERTTSRPLENNQKSDSDPPKNETNDLVKEILEK